MKKNLSKVVNLKQLVSFGLGVFFGYIITSTFADFAIFDSVIPSILSGVVSGYVVYLILELKADKKWMNSKRLVLNNYDVSLVSVLTTFRTAAKIKLERYNRDYVESVHFGLRRKLSSGDYDYSTFMNGIENLDIKSGELMLSNMGNCLSGLQFSINILSSYPRSEDWLLATAFDVSNKLNDLKSNYEAFPEIFDLQNKDPNIVYFREYFTREVVSLVIDIFNARAKIKIYEK